MEKITKNRALVMLLVSTFIISLLVLLSKFTPSENIKGLQEISEDEIPVNTLPLNSKDWKPKEWTVLEKGVEEKVLKNTRSTKKDKILLTAVANSGMSDYTMNWIISLKNSGLDDKFLVFAIDKEMVDIMTKEGYGDNVVLIPKEWFHKELSGEFEEWLSNGYTPITHSKTLVVERLLYAGITVWFSDVDIVFTSNALYEYLVMKLNSRKSTEVLFTQETEQNIINSGFYLMRPTRTNKWILDSSIYIQDKEPEVTQQRAMNRVLNELNLNYQSSPIALLDLTLFPHGRMFFDRNIPTIYNMTPMIVHANYRKGDNKKKDLKLHGLWYI